MNRRRAGEDFYFLHKIIPLGNFGEINETRVIPSPRKSDRVPFGTGRAVNQWIDSKALSTYALETFIDLKEFLQDIATYYRIDENRLNQLLSTLPDSIREFLISNDFSEEIERINNNTSSLNSFIGQFYSWFDGFKVLKYVHFARDNYYPNEPVYSVAKRLIEEIYSPVEDNISVKQLLDIYRDLDRNLVYLRQ